MKVIALFVTSLNGKITRGNDSNIHSWTSVEDQKLFAKKIENAKVVIMGSTTYESAKNSIQHKKGRTRIILTRTPAKYKDHEVPQLLEFTSLSPRKIVDGLKDKKISEIVLAGGAEIFSLFLKNKLVDEVHLTIEPTLFSPGKSILAETDLYERLNLVSSKKLNKQGTLYLVYKVLK